MVRILWYACLVVPTPCEHFEVPMASHDCPGSCGRQVPYHHFACRNCWYRLPMDLRRPISANWQRDAVAHAEAMADALQWYGQNTVKS
jgi:hypothetical protein